MAGLKTKRKSKSGRKKMKSKGSGLGNGKEEKNPMLGEERSDESDGSTPTEMEDEPTRLEQENSIAMVNVSNTPSAENTSTQDARNDIEASETKASKGVEQDLQVVSDKSSPMTTPKMSTSNFSPRDMLASGPGTPSSGRKISMNLDMTSTPPKPSTPQTAQDLSSVPSHSSPVQVKSVTPKRSQTEFKGSPTPPKEGMPTPTGVLDHNHSKVDDSGPVGQYGSEAGQIEASSENMIFDAASGQTEQKTVRLESAKKCGCTIS